MTRSLRIPGLLLALLCCGASLPVPAATAQGEEVPFDSDRWTRINAGMSEREGRPCLEGIAVLGDVEFQDGTIEFDVFMGHQRSYPGINFRVQSPQDYERFYIRPHRAGHYPDALQYVPVFHGIAGWQIYNGPGYTAEASLEADAWVHVKAEITGSQARFFVGEMDRPALRVDHLQHGISKGAVGVNGPRDGSACFAGFRYSTDAPAPPEPVAPPDARPGVIETWQISGAFPVDQVESEVHPKNQELAELQWSPVRADPGGLVDIARHAGRTGRMPDAVYARTTLHTEKPEVRAYNFGYSDAIVVFLNGQVLFSGSSAYRQRDPSFLGVVGLFDTVHLPLVAGDNELLILVAESFGGWGFVFQEAEVEFLHPTLEPAWETPDTFFIPESVVHDAGRGLLYVSNYDALGRSGGPGSQFLSKVGLDGEVLEREWVAGLDRPTGMAVAGDTLWVVERTGLARIDIESGEIVERHPIPGAAFPNDVAIDAKGTLYVSDSGRGLILRYRDGAFEEWRSGPEFAGPNGLAVQAGRLLVGTNGEHRLRAIDLKSGAVSTVTGLGVGVIDGLSDDGAGNVLLSHWEGRVFRIAADGSVEKLLDTSAAQTYCADFAWVPEPGLLVCPTFYGGTLEAYRTR